MTTTPLTVFVVALLSSVLPSEELGVSHAVLTDAIGWVRAAGTVCAHPTQVALCRHTLLRAAQHPGGMHARGEIREAMRICHVHPHALRSSSVACTTALRNAREAVERGNTTDPPVPLLDTCQAEISTLVKLVKNASALTRSSAQQCVLLPGNRCVSMVATAAQSVYGLVGSTQVVVESCDDGRKLSCEAGIENVSLIVNATTLDMIHAEKVCGPINATLDCTLNTGAASLDLERAISLLDNHIIIDCIKE